MTTTRTTPHGLTITHGEVVQTAPDSFLRYDESKRPGEVLALREHVHAASATDDSPQYMDTPGYIDDSHARCGWCWINAPHTLDAHNKDIAHADK